MKQPSILWHDYETFGANPRLDRPVQFAAVRTDLELNEVEKPIELFCAPANDYLPAPDACLITGITPQIGLSRGDREVDFIRKVNNAFSVPGTCGAGYNSIRFDDEVTRFSLYRNMLDPYAREWQNGNSRWDIIDMVRTCYALRPEKINWPEREDGSPSFKLEHLSAANGLAHESAHDAVSDVRATIAMARLVKEKQPRLYEYLFNLRNKREVAKLIDVVNMKPLLHISSKFPALQGCCNWVVPLAWHPVNKNEVIVAQLSDDPAFLSELDAETIHARIYSRQVDLDGPRPPIKTIHLNRCPVLAPAKMLTPENAKRLGIDRQACLRHLDWWRNNYQVRDVVLKVFEVPYSFNEEEDIDSALYSGFISNQDRAICQVIHTMDPVQLAGYVPSFEDPKLTQLYFRFRARNWPETLTEEESQKWQQFRQERLFSPGGKQLDVESYLYQVQELAEQYSDDRRKIAILKKLYQYAQQL